MKRSLWNITLASVITLVAYVALYAVWGAILSELESKTLQLLLIALMTTVAFGVILLWVSKVRRSTGEDEVMADYKDRTYTSMADDLKLIFRREVKALILMTVIVMGTYILNRLDTLMFGQKTISHITMPYLAMSLFGALFRIRIIGYLLSAVLNPCVYLFALLLYRRKKYNYWMKNQG